MDPIYLDFQASTPLDPRVLEAMLPWLRSPSNPHAIENSPGRDAHDAVELAREKVAEALHGKAGDVVFTSGATESVNIVLRNLVPSSGRLVISAIEHPCVSETAKWLEGQGADVEVVRVDEDGLIDMDDLERALDQKPDLVSIMAVNNEIGTIQPLSEIAVLSRHVGTRFHTDAAQAVGRIPLRAEEHFDIATLSGHKIYGPQGIGALIACGDALQSLRPLATGGGQERGVRPGTVPVALCVGLGEACRLAVAEREDDARHVANLADRLIERLHAEVGSFAINGSTAKRVPHNLNISVPGVNSDELLARVPELSLSTGSACSSGAIEPSRVLRAIGIGEERLEGAIRIGLGRTTTVTDIDNAATAIGRAARECVGQSRSEIRVSA